MADAPPREKPALTPGAFLVRGLLVGLVAGLLAFAVAYLVGEQYVERAIELEEAALAEHSPGDTAGDHGGHDEEAPPVERADQRTWGLLTGTLAIGVTYGGVAGLVAAGAVGRLGRLGARATTGLVALLGFCSLVLVPFLKYPANPPAVGDPDTITERTSAYFGMQGLSVLAAISAVWLAVLLARRIGGFEAAVAGAAAYLAVVGVAAALMPSINEVTDFPAALLWSFRVSSLITSGAMWAAIGVGLTALVGRLSDRVQADAARRALAASL